MVVVSKPSGLLVHRTHLAPDRDVLLQRARRLVGCHLYPVHRLDRGASGLVCFAKSAADARWLQAALAAPEATKEYRVLLRGTVTAPFVADRPLRSGSGAPVPSVTEVEPLEHLAGCTLAAIRIRTGRRHQIRRHMNHAGHHVVGDTTHGKGPINRRCRADFGLHRLFLHALRVRVRHVPHETDITVEDPLPDELRSVLAMMRADR